MSKRFVTIAEYQRLSGLSYPTVKNALETGQLKGVKTEAGHWKIDTQDAGNTDTSVIVKRLDEAERLLKAYADTVTRAYV
ncbi:MAG: hypothetical protein LBQ48_03370 [Oscillospiraceae bacterium]|jgi:hypothetical protein|nr:hypothetical protein [Oscillospiraceae bacterium]